MKESEKYVGKEFKHPILGRVFVDSIHENSRVMVNVTVIDRGPGWNDIKQDYTGIKTKVNGGHRWSRGQNYQYGQTDFVHINNLSEIGQRPSVTEKSTVPSGMYRRKPVLHE